MSITLHMQIEIREIFLYSTCLVYQLNGVVLTAGFIEFDTLGMIWKKTKK